VLSSNDGVEHAPMGRKGRDMLAAFACYMQTFIGIIVCDFKYTYVFAENRKRKQLKCFSCQIDDIILILPSKVVIYYILKAQYGGLK
jgi:hypothetical protein